MKATNTICGVQFNNLLSALPDRDCKTRDGDVNCDKSFCT